MIANLLNFSQELLAQALKITLLEEDYRQIAQIARQVHPSKLRQFWQSMTAKPGLYVIQIGRAHV